jgi:ketosteroid isomerase-like protein
MRRWLVALALLAAAAPAAADDRADLLAIEADSHRLWLRGDTAALAELMAEEYRFVVMNGAVERRAEIVGDERRTRQISVRSLELEPGEVTIRGGTAAVISTMRLDGSVQGRPLPGRMRVLSVYTRDGENWRLLARSITPILAPPRPTD